MAGVKVGSGWEDLIYGAEGLGNVLYVPCLAIGISECRGADSVGERRKGLLSRFPPQGDSVEK
jgi:hypothetical protein